MSVNNCMSNDFFEFKTFTIHQCRAAMKVGTDGVILGAWHAIGGNPKNILDIGSGTGLVALMMAQRFPHSFVDAVEIDLDAFLDGEENISSSPYSSRIKTYHLPFQEYCAECGKRYDVIVSNPPFFLTSLHNPNKGRAIARHADTLPFAVLTQGASQLLSESGVLAVVLPTESVDTFLGDAVAAGLSLSVHTAVKTTERKNPKRHLMLFSKTLPSEIIRETVCLQNPDGSRSAWYAEMTHDFYVK